MAKKIIKLTESKINKLISETITKILTENYASERDVDTTELGIIADRYKKYAQEIELFIKEFETFLSFLQQTAQKLGLVLIDKESDGMSDDDSKPYQKIVYTFTDGTQPNSLYGNDEAYEKLCYKMEQLGSELEDEINPRNYRSMQVKVNYGDDVTVDVEFRLWD